MKRYKIGEWIPLSERTPTVGEKKKYIILYYYDEASNGRYMLNAFVSTDSVYGSRIKTYWMKINYPACNDATNCVTLSKQTKIDSKG